ncbi:MAG TPA: tetratricopeptide repeat protein [Blastocatellia bacterium]|nr:tetratricopeptide repeat protein [Blastocatellia bacterium]
MGTNGSKDVPLIFSDFIEYLRRQGFVIGVEHYLRLHRVLSLNEGVSAPHDLKTFLCPVFATSKAEQEQFYQAFDSFFAIFHAAVAGRESNVTAAPDVMIDARRAEPLGARRWPYAIAATAVLALIFLIVTYATRDQVRPENIVATRVDKPVPVESPQGQSGDPGQPPQPDAGPREPGARAQGPQAAEPQPVETAPAVEPEQPEPAAPAVVEQSFYERYKNAIRAGVVLAPLVIFLFYEWYRLNRRNLVLQKQRGKKPPLLWPIKVKAPRARLYDAETFYTATRLMRRRQAGESERLDVEATVTATIESLGYPSFRYRAETRQPEYLVLIDRASYRDHQAQLYSHLARALERESIFVEIYFYEGDPRLCRGGAGDAVHLEDLKHKYSAHRLLVFGNGEKMIDPITGDLAEWASSFSDWPDRALLTTEPVERWGLREITLAGQFVLLPATLEGLLAVVESFDISSTADLRGRLEVDLAAPPRELDRDGAVAALREYLKEETFQWLCACAVYPELHWDLTLYLGSLACMPESLVREENLLKLARLPWFRAGAMPDELRWELIRELDKDKEKAIRAAIIELLETSSPPEETIASDTYQLNLVVQRWLLRRDRKRRREMLRAIKNLPQSRVVRDYTILRFLESSRHSPIDFILPRRLRKVFYRNGVPAFGLKTGVRLFASACVTIIIALVLYRDALLPVFEATPPSEIAHQQRKKANVILLDTSGSMIRAYKKGLKDSLISPLIDSSAFGAQEQVIVRWFDEKMVTKVETDNPRAVLNHIPSPEQSTGINTDLESAVDRTLLDATVMDSDDVLIWVITDFSAEFEHSGTTNQFLERANKDENIRTAFKYSLDTFEDTVMYLFYYSQKNSSLDIDGIASDVRQRVLKRIGEPTQRRGPFYETVGLKALVPYYTGNITINNEKFAVNGAPAALVDDKLELPTVPEGVPPNFIIRFHLQRRLGGMTITDGRIAATKFSLQLPQSVISRSDPAAWSTEISPRTFMMNRDPATQLEYRLNLISVGPSFYPASFWNGLWNSRSEPVEAIFAFTPIADSFIRNEYVGSESFLDRFPSSVTDAHKSGRPILIQMRFQVEFDTRRRRLTIGGIALIAILFALSAVTISGRVFKRKSFTMSHLLICLLMSILSAAISVYIFVLLPAENKLADALRKAVDENRLITDGNDDAYTYYHQLKATDPDNKVFSHLYPKLVDGLWNIGNEIVDRGDDPGGEPLFGEDWHKAARAYRWLSQLDDRARARELYAEGKLAMLERRMEEAERNFRAAGSLDSTWASPLNSLGVLRSNAREYAEATALFNRAIELDPNWAVPYYNLGILYYSISNYDLSERNYKRALELSPNWAKAHYWLGFVYEQQKRRLEAIKEYTAALTIAGSNEKAIDKAQQTHIRKLIDELKRR